ncbi:uncharacterized protein MELLADRAFT_49185 [Melampsora larici-populina 98AG31]|uniref:AAA+ ATPase domain-containing protein n=1 Tax=Melampsora larici-populina (strain 98AG31 / pathotype 3-4-7) TaxID=747676 RepID=F4RT69_MELLP|nr:uncharacterized protein MELLADRAFT_49185 [Melampsora larici-populina 98AG31]EGG04455.1 hypothetical protein MELLADRAFT_49185 [Melampsora larici-populina 98AG31]
MMLRSRSLAGQRPFQTSPYGLYSSRTLGAASGSNLHSNLGPQHQLSQSNRPFPKSDARNCIRCWSSTLSSPPTATQPLPEVYSHHSPNPPELLSQLSSSRTPGGPIDIYSSRVKAGILKEDAYQLTIVAKLQDMYDRLVNYHPHPIEVEKPSSVATTSGWLSNLFGSKSHTVKPPSISDLNAPKGLYLHGSVGTGKSMLMDLFYDSLPSLSNPTLPARRIHFHQFMSEVHKRNHALQYRTDGTENHSQTDVLVTIAKEIARECRILCFDEFQVTDIVDAMILKRLFETLIAYGVVCVMTSNRHPDELYKNGIQRVSFLPCIELIKSHFLVTDLNSGTDYRKQPHALSKVYYTPIDQPNRSEFQKLFEALTDDEPVLPNRPLTIWGRTLKVPLSTNEVAWFSFQELCGNPLSASDYLEIVKQFRIVFLTDVPKLTLSQRDMARRLILFLDAAYESKTKLFTLSEVPITQVFSDSAAESTTSDNSISPEMRAAMDDLGLNLTSIGKSSLFSGEEETFAWARAVSRLSEMGTLNWSLQNPSTKNLSHQIGVSDLIKDLDGDESSLLVH